MEYIWLDSIGTNCRPTYGAVVIKIVALVLTQTLTESISEETY